MNYGSVFDSNYFIVLTTIPRCAEFPCMDSRWLMLTNLEFAGLVSKLLDRSFKTHPYLNNPYICILWQHRFLEVIQINLSLVCIHVRRAEFYHAGLPCSQRSACILMASHRYMVKYWGVGKHSAWQWWSSLGPVHFGARHLNHSIDRIINW